MVPYSKIPSINKLNQAAIFQTNVSTIVLQCSPLKYHVFENIMENGAFSIIPSKVFTTLLKIFLIFFICFLKKENDLKIAYRNRVQSFYNTPQYNTDLDITWSCCSS